MARAGRALAVVGMLVMAACSVQSDEIRGVQPEDAHLYAKKDMFTCKDGSSTFSFDKVNDEFCDCNDGSDEPGTAACANGVFWCANKGWKAKLLFSSRVNDGVCDCCDGSDEHSGIVSCANRCQEEGAEQRNLLMRSIQLHEQGVAKRPEYVARAHAFREAVFKRRDDLAKLIQEVSQKIDVLQVQKDELNKKISEETEERMRQEQEAREAEEKQRAEEEQKRAEELAAQQAEMANQVPSEEEIKSSGDEFGSPEVPPMPPQTMDAAMENAGESQQVVEEGKGYEDPSYSGKHGDKEPSTTGNSDPNTHVEDWYSYDNDHTDEEKPPEEEYKPPEERPKTEAEVKELQEPTQAWA
eukprot:766053-Hanusia_phi.AAC.3